jgi:hypothetical protein
MKIFALLLFIIIFNACDAQQDEDKNKDKSSNPKTVVENDSQNSDSQSTSVDSNLGTSPFLQERAPVAGLSENSSYAFNLSNIIQNADTFTLHATNGTDNYEITDEGKSLISNALEIYIEEKKIRFIAHEVNTTTLFTFTLKGSDTKNQSIETIYSLNVFNYDEDKSLILSKITLPTTVIFNTDAIVKFTLEDIDNIESATLILRDNTADIIQEKTFFPRSTLDKLDIEQIYTALLVGEYTLTLTAQGVVLGEGNNSYLERSYNFSVYIPDALSTLQAPSLLSVDETTITVEAGLVQDNDGVDNISIELYRDQTLNELIETNSEGVFSNLDSQSRYFAITTARTKNATSGEFERKTSSALGISTANVIDVLTTITPPLLLTVNDNVITVEIGEFLDDDGIQNVSTIISKDRSFNTIIDANSSGIFNNLEEDTLYFLVTIGEAFNSETEIFETKISTILEVRTEVSQIDTTPDQFVLIDQIGIALGALSESLDFNVTGINSPTTITVNNGEYRINDQNWTNSEGIVVRNDTVRVRHTSSFNFSTTISSLLTIGEISESFSTTTIDIPISIPTISFEDQSILEENGSITASFDAPTVNNVSSGAIYAFIENPTQNRLSINEESGVMQYDGNETVSTQYSITISVTNPDTGTASTTFNLDINVSGS